MTKVQSVRNDNTSILSLSEILAGRCLLDAGMDAGMDPGEWTHSRNSTWWSGGKNRQYSMMAKEFL